MSSGEDDEVDLSALATISETCREFRRLHEASDRAMAVIPRWYALCVNDAAMMSIAAAELRGGGAREDVGYMDAQGCRKTIGGLCDPQRTRS